MDSEDGTRSLWPLIQLHAARLRRNGRRRLTGRTLALLFVVFGSLDVVSTEAAMAAGFAEGNPFVRLMQEHLGTWWVVLKVAAHVLLGAAILWLPTRRLLLAAAAMVAVYAVIVARNLLLAGWFA